MVWRVDVGLFASLEPWNQPKTDGTLMHSASLVMQTETMTPHRTTSHENLERISLSDKFAKLMFLRCLMASLPSLVGSK